MKLEGIKKNAPPRPRAKAIKGLTKDAATLGISRYFLWRVLRGYSTSAPTLVRYNQLKTTKTTAP